MSIDVQDAIKRSIQTEKNAMNFYQLGAQQMKNQDARKTFKLLAREEREHAGQFFKIYTGTDIPSLEAFLDTPFDNESSWIASITRLVDSGSPARSSSPSTTTSPPGSSYPLATSLYSTSAPSTEQTLRYRIRPPSWAWTSRSGTACSLVALNS